MSPETRVYSSFRDPAGGVFESNGRIYRRVTPEYQKDYELLISSGLYSRLVFEGLIIPHQEIEKGLLLPTRIDTISYPYEWCFSMLKDAALTTLRIQLLSLEFGMDLKDASAYNVQFYRGKMVLIDTLSIMSRQPDTPWVAYGQFCRHFLGPLALMSKVDIRLGQLSRLYLDGVPLDLVSELLPFTTNLGLNLHLKVHSKLGKRTYKPTKVPVLKMRLPTLVTLLKGLVKLVNSLEPKSEWADWSDYNQCSYTPSAFNSKFRTVGDILDTTPSRVVLDLGANTGNFSRLACRKGSRVVSVDSSHGCIESAYRDRTKYSNLLPLLMDITNPCTGVGWEGQERPPLQRRVKPDLVLALALIHHLAISSALPLEYLSKYFRSWDCPVLMEFIPKFDTQVPKLFPGGLDIFPNYTEDGFTKNFSSEFRIEKRVPIEDSARVLYYMVPKDLR